MTSTLKPDLHRRPAPALIQYGWVHRLRYLPDFGRYEAAVILRLNAAGPGKDVEVIASVSAHQDEDPSALRRRLVLEAARLMRLCEAGLDPERDLAIAA